MPAVLVEVNCRIGSLEKKKCRVLMSQLVNCRIGSLEMEGSDDDEYDDVNCRIGSLESIEYMDDGDLIC